MKAGSIDNYFTIELNAETQDTDTGAITDSWSGSENMWGSLRSPNAREVATRNNDTIVISHVVDCRFNQTIYDNPKKCRLKLGSRYFVLSNLISDDRKKEMTLFVAEML